jgi:non-specific serine/threonine protein kinase
LDNCEHVRAPAAEIAATLIEACPRLRILATSRERLAAPGERAWPVPPLALPSAAAANGWERSEAVRLFVDRARFALPAFTLDARTGPAVAELCRILEGLPLAIELAAARLRHISLEEIRARLDDQLRLLADPGRVAEPRQQAMRAAIDWSHALLGEGERRVFRRLAVFAGGFAIDAAEAICVDEEIASAEVLPILASLVDRSLVRADTTGSYARYSLLDVVRQYARERLEAAREADLVEERRAHFFVRLAEELEPERVARDAAYPDRIGQVDPARRFVLEHANVRGAVAWLLRNDPAAVRRVLARAWNYYIFLGPGVDGAEIEEWLVRGLAVNKTRDALRARLLLGLSVRRSLADPAGAGAAAEEALAIAREIGDERARGGAHYRLALWRIAEGDRHAAIEQLGEGIGAVHPTSPLIAAWFQATRGLLRAEAGDMAGARSDLDEALATCEQFPERRRGHAVVLTFLGQYALVAGDHAAAEKAFREVAEIFRQMGSEVPVARALDGLAVIGAKRGGHERALRLAGAAEAAREQGGDTMPRRAVDAEAIQDSVRRVGARAKVLLAEGRRMTTERAVALALAPRAPNRLEGLSPREREVATLVAHGLTDREIAGALRIAERTAENHVQHILTKLGLRSRAQVARWATERGLVSTTT